MIPWLAFYNLPILEPARALCGRYDSIFLPQWAWVWKLCTKTRISWTLLYHYTIIFSLENALLIISRNNALLLLPERHPNIWFQMCALIKYVWKKIGRGGIPPRQDITISEEESFLKVLWQIWKMILFPQFVTCEGILRPNMVTTSLAEEFITLERGHQVGFGISLDQILFHL